MPGWEVEETGNRVRLFFSTLLIVLVAWFHCFFGSRVGLILLISAVVLRVVVFWRATRTSEERF